MPDASQIQFEKRVRRIRKSHARLARGYVTSINHDGLIIARPRRAGFVFPFRGLFFACLVLLAFKGFVMASLGAETYEDRVSRLAAGNAVERAGAFVMAADPITNWVSAQFAKLTPEIL